MPHRSTGGSTGCTAFYRHSKHASPPALPCRVNAARVGARGALRRWAREVREQRLMTAALRRLINTALTAALLRLRAVAAATATRHLALRRWRGAAVVHALRTWRDAAALASRTGKVLRSVASLLMHYDVARGWRSWVALTAARQRLHVVVWRVLQHQSVLALNTWRHGAAPHPAPHPVLHRAPHPPPPTARLSPLLPARHTSTPVVQLPRSARRRGCSCAG